MGALVKVKSWKHWSVTVADGTGPAQQRVNSCSCGNSCRSCRQLIWEIKNVLCASPAAWTVVKSCGRVGGWDGYFASGASDYWGTAEDVWWPYDAGSGKEFSWIVLKNTAISAVGQGFQLLISTGPNITSCNPYKINAWISLYDGFSGGDTQNNPTGGNQVRWAADDWTSGSNYNRGAQIFKSTDGECTRIQLTANAALGQLWMFDRAQAVHAAWDYPYLCLPGALPTYAYLSANYNTLTRWGNGDMHHIEYIPYTVGVPLVTEGAAGIPLGGLSAFATADYWGNWICTKAGVAALNINAPGGFLGWVQDLWFTSDDLVDGDYMPGDGSKQFVVFGDIVQPNEDGTTVVIY